MPQNVRCALYVFAGETVASLRRLLSSNTPGGIAELGNIGAAAISVQATLCGFFLTWSGRIGIYPFGPIVVIFEVRFSQAGQWLCCRRH